MIQLNSNLTFTRMSHKSYSTNLSSHSQVTPERTTNPVVSITHQVIICTYVCNCLNVFVSIIIVHFP